VSTESDRQLVQRIRRNDAAAWDELFRRYQGRLGAYVRRRLRDHASVDDVVQETFIGFHNSLPNYDDRRDLQTWLFTIASHKVTDALRRIGRRPVTPGGGGGDDGDGDPLDRSPDAKARAASSLARSSERREREEEALGRALLAIVSEWRTRGDYQSVMVLELLFVKGAGNKEVSALVGVTEQQVANVKFQAKKRLHEFLRAAKLSADVFPELKSD
jgi:RNA polymerase sigma-70 factor (ECF subfamily)